MLALCKESVVAVVADDELAILAPDDVVMRPEASRWVVINEYLLTCSDCKLPKYIVRHTVCLVHEEIVTLSVLSVLRILVALELNQCSILATIRGFSLIRLEPVEQPS